MEHPHAADCQWYVMLFPGEEERRAIVAAFGALAGLVGGEVNDRPHVTVGYFRGAADADAVAEALRPLRGPAIGVRASGLFSFSEEPTPLYGWTLSLNVRRDPALQRWQRAATDAVAPLGLAPIFAAGEQRAHVNALRHLPLPPAEALARLPDRDHPIAFTAARLVLTERCDDEFTDRLDQPLG